MADHWVAAFIPALLLALLAARARVRGGSWLEPSALFALAWSLYVLLPLLLAPDFEVWPGGVWWILLSIYSVCCGSWWAGRGKDRVPGQQPRASRSTFALPAIKSQISGLRIVLVITLLCGLLYSLVAILNFGFGLGTLFSTEGIVELARAFSVDRYSEAYVPPGFLVQVWLIGVYAAPIFGGLLFSARRNKADVFLSISSIVPAFSVFLIQTARAPVVLALSLWVSGSFAQSVFSHPEGVRIFSKKRTYALLALALFLVVIFGVGQVMRGGRAPEVEVMQDMLLSDTPRVFMLGHISVFTRWFHETAFSLTSPALGAYSVAGLFDQLGIHPRPLGLYLDFYEIVPGMVSNIFTVFRGFIEDFTLPGSLLFLFLVGMYAGRAYDRVREGDLRYAPVLIAAYAFSGSYGVSIFNYNSILFSWLIAAIYLRTVSGHKSQSTRPVSSAPVTGMA
jgi:oligosaccharide repeat unit polymerase